VANSDHLENGFFAEHRTWNSVTGSRLEDKIIANWSLQIDAASSPQARLLLNGQAPVARKPEK
jgi:hypothetical protein